VAPYTRNVTILSAGMDKWGGIELVGVTVLFIGASTAVGMARGHAPGVWLALLLPLVLAAIITLVARFSSPSSP
jgi:hypothetical protein